MEQDIVTQHEKVTMYVVNINVAKVIVIDVLRVAEIVVADVDIAVVVAVMDIIVILIIIVRMLAQHITVHKT